MSDKQMKAKMEALYVANEKLKLAHEDRDKTFRELFPVGSRVDYVYQGISVQTAIVTQHSYDDALFAENQSTGKLVKISSYHILRARTEEYI